jgi:hypothetical protein
MKHDLAAANPPLPYAHILQGARWLQAGLKARANVRQKKLTTQERLHLGKAPVAGAVNAQAAAMPASSSTGRRILPELSEGHANALQRKQSY